MISSRRGATAMAIVVALIQTAPSSPRLSQSDAALWARLVAAVDTRDTDTTLFAEALAQGGSLVRRAAARAAGETGATAFAPRLQQLLHDDDPDVVMNAAL